MSLEGSIAAHRFGLGARPGEIDAASRSPREWLERQIQSPVPQPDPAGLQPTPALVKVRSDYTKARKEALKVGKKAADIANPIREIFTQEMLARFALGFSTDRPFAERLVWFWSNHLAVSGQDPQATGFLGAYEREAIRPHVLGKFADLVLASARHPAMLIYLDNGNSIGPGSKAGMRVKRGLNENYGRELMELHTLGVDGGYTQVDVIALAKILTGWSVSRGDDGKAFDYFANRHEPGDIKLLGKTYPPTEAGGIQAVRDLANHPKTARHIAAKFATHFIAEKPSAASVDKLTAVFRQTGGDLKALALAAIADPAGWAPGNTRVRTPVEFVTATARAFAFPKGPVRGNPAMMRVVRRAMQGCRTMGEFPFMAASPKGYDDMSAAWSGPDAILTRLEWANQVGTAAPRDTDPSRLANNALGALLRPETKLALQRAASPTQAIALVLASPEFQRR